MSNDKQEFLCKECRTFHHPAEPHGATLGRKLQTVDAAEFGLRIARSFNESKSSTTIFFIQQAFKDYDDDNGLSWDVFQKMFDRFEADSAITQPEPHTTSELPAASAQLEGRWYSVGDVHPTISSYRLTKIYASGSLLYTREAREEFGRGIDIESQIKANAICETLGVQLVEGEPNIIPAEAKKR